MLELPVTPIDALQADFVDQDWHAYTAAQHAVWAAYVERRMTALQGTASRLFLQSIESLELSPDRIPDLAPLNERLAVRTGWQIVPISGLPPRRGFFAMLARRRWPVLLGLRTDEELDYTGPEPDLFHGLFGHVPMLAHRTYADFLQHFGVIAGGARTEAELLMITRLYWFTVEFGLVREGGRDMLFGAGLLSSAETAARALGPDTERRPFSVEAAVRQPFTTDREQEVFFVIDDFRSLWGVADDAGRRLALRG